VLIAVGGADDYVVPALAVAHDLVESRSAEILFVGTQRGRENWIVPEAGFSLRLIDAYPSMNASVVKKIRLLIELPRSINACRRLIRDFQPNVVLGAGGSASGPAVAAARQLNLPTMVFEPNAIRGLAHRLVGKKVQAAAVNFQCAIAYFHHAEVTGIPVNPELFSLPTPSPKPPHLLILGGSHNSCLFNTSVPKIAKELIEAIPGLTILHQCGLRKDESTREAYAAGGADPSRWEVQPFFDDMPPLIARANLVLARSSALTGAELAAAGKPALVVPLTGDADEYQMRNAEEMRRSGAATLVEDWKSDHPIELLQNLIQLLRSPEKLSMMSAAARAQAHPGAAQRIAGRLVELAKKDSRVAI